MKKELFLFYFLLLFSLTFISASPACSDGSLPDSALKEVSIEERKSANGLGISLVDAEETIANNRMAADVILDVQKISLSNETPEADVDFASEEATVILLEATEESATIRIGSSSGEIEVGSHKEVAGYELMITEAHGTSTSDMSAELIIGTEFLEFSNKDSLSFIKTIGEETYLIEMVSASDANALFKVSTCGTGEVMLKTETEEAETNEIIAPKNQTAQNETISGPEMNSTEPEQQECSPGQRETDQYCNEDSALAPQKEPGTICANDYECTLNECSSGKCKDLGFFSRLFRFFKNIFG